MSERKLGYVRSVYDPRTLIASRYMASPLLEPPPEEGDFGKAVTLPWGMMQNDVLGDCVIAGAGHLEMTWTANRGHSFRPSDQAIVDGYQQVGGYVPGDPATDQGCDPLTALKFWRNTGIAGHKIDGFALLNGQDSLRLKQTISIFQGVYLGLALPYAAAELEDWDIPNGQTATDVWSPGSWGGHMVCGVRYNPEWCYVVTWGELKRASWRFICTYTEEAYAVLSPDMLDLTTGQSHAGLEVQALRDALSALDNQ